jgi:protein arginine kinase activator
MKMCDDCGSNPANVHLTQIVNNETNVFNLCMECARKKGISIQMSEGPVEEPAAKVPEVTCTRCRLSLSEFREKGWLGCPDCYRAFEREIEELLHQMHGAAPYKGKRYSRSVGTKIDTKDLVRLRHELNNAIRNEQFERAAAIRDRINLMGASEQGGKDSVAR